MKEQEILDVCTKVLRDILADETVELTMRTRREEVPNWDSLAYVTFIAVLEEHCGVKFGVADIESFADVGAIVRRIHALSAAQ